ncbi:hypothetical protein [Streptomyces hilarionis]|uniref:hypothetical protein n=1 Tax=Streptomyces hilarionis TaxID=2839954 RepID=UPI00211A2FFA|nr:hypothetical protein [Streptomyces hilarionis]MCQ9131482.1 hypothetical protein [Streptomyces hilarionis]
MAERRNREPVTARSAHTVTRVAARWIAPPEPPCTALPVGLEPEAAKENQQHAAACARAMAPGSGGRAPDREARRHSRAPARRAGATAGNAAKEAVRAKTGWWSATAGAVVVVVGPTAGNALVAALP